jgi:hypothetical protein
VDPGELQEGPTQTLSREGVRSVHEV